MDSRLIYPKPIKQSQLHECLLAVTRKKQIPAPAAPIPLITRFTLAEKNRRKPRILLAEDNAVNQKIALRILEKMGCRADAVASGKEAVDAFSMLPYDLILMDVQMPEMDGMQATGLIREKEKGTGRHIPIIALTAHAMKGDREKCLESGMDGYLSKPVQPNELAEAIEQALAGAAQATGGTPPLAGEAKVFDFAAALRTVDGDEKFLMEVSEMFLADAQQQIRKIAAAAMVGVPADVQLYAHTLKGSASNLGAAALRDVALELEMSARNGELKGAEILVDRLRLEYARLEKELLAFIAAASAAH